MPEYESAMMVSGEAACPREIAFLARHGVRPDILDTVAVRARTLGLSADSVAIGEGFVTAETFYRALAAELGAPFLTHVEVARAPSGSPAAFHAGVVALPGGARSHALAPRGAAIARLLETGAELRARIAIATPAALADGVRQACAADIAIHAAYDLPARRPELSALRSLNLPQYLSIALAVLLLSFFGALAPAATLIVAGLVLGPVFLMLATLRMAAAFEPMSGAETIRKGLLGDAELPIYTVLVPLFREARVFRQLLAALLRLEYPRAKLDVKLLIEADDEETRGAASACDLPAFVSVVIVPPGQPRTKPRALNAGLLEARGELLAIFDAEDVPDPDQLRIAASVLKRSPRRTACVQARLAIDNAGDSLLTRLFSLEYAGLFDVINPGLVKSGLPFLIGGTSNHFRTDVLRELGGWDAWNVTEDADLAVRLARAGYAIGDCPATTWEEAPARFSLWMRQRRRWMKGFIQTAVTHSRRPVLAMAELGLARAAALASLCLGTVLSALVYPLFLIAMLLALHDGRLLTPTDAMEAFVTSLALTTFGIGLFAIFAPAIVGALRRRQWRQLWLLPLLPVYVLMVSLAAWRGLIDWIVAPHHWLKTDHGLARTSLHARPEVSATRATPSPLRPAVGQG